MDHFNAMFEDETTRSWWQQATGIAIAGPRKGERLGEIPSAQYTLEEWLRMHPGSKVMQPDPGDSTHYANLVGYDDGTIKGSLEHRDSASWRAKSWVVGVISGNNAKAYDWTWLDTHRVVDDTIGMVPVLIYRSDSVNFHAFNRVVSGQTLDFEYAKSALFPDDLVDSTTRSVWTRDGRCISGALKGQQLQFLPSYQEFWHSWSYFHPTTSRYND
jgi:hypothetical protein